MAIQHSRQRGPLHFSQNVIITFTASNKMNLFHSCATLSLEKSTLSGCHIFCAEKPWLANEIYSNYSGIVKIAQGELPITSAETRVLLSAIYKGIFTCLLAQLFSLLRCIAFAAQGTWCRARTLKKLIDEFHYSSNLFKCHVYVQSHPRHFYCQCVCWLGVAVRFRPISGAC